MQARLAKGEYYGLGFTLALVLLVLGLGGFWAILGGIGGDGTLRAWDLRVQAAMTAVVSPGLTRWAIHLTSLGGYAGSMACVAAVSLTLLLLRRWWSAFGLFAATFGVGTLLSPLKALFERPRPLYQVVEAAGYSFPSGHALATIVFWGYIAWLIGQSRRRGWLKAPTVLLCIVMALLVGTSRLYLNVHWFSDVLGGWAAGLAWLAAWVLLVRYLDRPIAYTGRSGNVANQSPPAPA